MKEYSSQSIKEIYKSMLKTTDNPFGVLKEKYQFILKIKQKELTKLKYEKKVILNQLRRSANKKTIIDNTIYRLENIHNKKKAEITHLNKKTKVVSLFAISFPILFIVLGLYLDLIANVSSYFLDISPLIVLADIYTYKGFKNDITFKVNSLQLQKKSLSAIINRHNDRLLNADLEHQNNLKKLENNNKQTASVNAQIRIIENHINLLNGNLEHDLVKKPKQKIYSSFGNYFE